MIERRKRKDKKRMPNRIIWATSCIYTRNSATPPHSHGFYQFLYVKSEHGRMRIGDHFHDLTKGHIYLVPPSVLHEIRASEAGLITYEIKFELEDAQIEHALAELPESLCLSDSEAENVFKDIFNEMRNMNIYQSEMLDVKLRELLLILLRQNEKIKNPSQQRVDFSEKFSEVLFYMGRHIAEDITLEKLADIAHLEKIYFLKQFKKDMKTTPMHYLRTLRMNEAKKLLKHSDMNITQIAAAVGFPDIHHFSCTFKKQFDISPSDYKRAKSDLNR